MSLRCVYCHDDLDPVHVSCRCGARYHEECATERCATFACGPLQRVRPAGAPTPRPAWSGKALAVLALAFLAVPLLSLGAMFGPQGFFYAACLLGGTLIALFGESSTTRAATPATPGPPESRPEPRPEAPCVLCVRPALPGGSTCADHAALLEDSLGATAVQRIRPGSLYGPGLIDAGGGASGP